MRTLRAVLARLAGSWPSGRRERDLAEELESHLQMHVDDNVRAGMPLDEARREAVLKLGGVEATKEAYRERAGLPFVEHSWQDLRFAVRQLSRNPAFALTAVGVLALGIGASGAVFAIVDAALVQPLPYRDPTRIVSVTEAIAADPLRRTPLSHADYLDWKRLIRSFESLDTYTGGGHLLATPTGAEVVSGARVTAGFFRTLAVAPALGRSFLAGEDAPGGPEVVILSHGAWQRYFGASADVVGRSVLLSDVPHTVVGVLPREFQFAPLGRAEFWTLVRGRSPCEQRRSCHNLRGIARLRAGVDVATADAEAKSLAARLEREYPDSNRGQGASVVPLSEEIVGGIRPVLLVLLGGAGLLLLIAAVNVTSLLMVRAESRRAEISVRHALGAARGRLVRQFLTEGLLLVTVSGSLGLALAAGTVPLLLRLVPAGMMDGMPFLQGLGLNRHVLAFVGSVSALSALLLTLAPYLRLPRQSVREGLTADGRTAAGTAWRRFASHLVVVELAVAMVLLAGALLLDRSLERLLAVELGFEPEALATVTVALPAARSETPEKTVALAREIVRRVTTLPGVESAAVTSLLPVSFNGNTDWIRFVGRPYDGEHNEVNQRDVGALYFRTLRAKLLSGRTFTDDEDAKKPRVVVINRALARRYFAEEDPVGKQIGDTGLSPGSIKEIVGVVDDIREGQLDEEVWPAVYYPFNQSGDSSFSLVVRSARTDPSVLLAIAAELRRIDPGLGTLDPVVMSDRIDRSPSAYLHRSSASLIGGFAAVALLLGAVGLYGVVAYSVGRRAKEIGLRMALGARPSAVYRLVLVETARLVARRRRGRPRRRSGRGRRAPPAALRDTRGRPVGPVRGRRGHRRGRAPGRLPARAPRRVGRPDDRPAGRIVGCRVAAAS